MPSSGIVRVVKLVVNICACCGSLPEVCLEAVYGVATPWVYVAVCTLQQAGDTSGCTFAAVPTLIPSDSTTF